MRRRLDGRPGIDFVRCRICGARRRVIATKHLSTHDTDREEYMEEYGLSPDQLIAKDFRIIQSSRRGYQPYGITDWIAAIKKIHKNGGSIRAGDLQRKNQNLFCLIALIEGVLLHSYGLFWFVPVIGITLFVVTKIMPKLLGRNPVKTVSAS